MTGKATQQMTGLDLKMQSKFGGDTSIYGKKHITVILGGFWFIVHIYHFTKCCMVPSLKKRMNILKLLNLKEWLDHKINVKHHIKKPRIHLPYTGL